MQATMLKKCRAGVFQGCFVKWQQTCDNHQWRVFAKMCPRLAATHHEIPNFVKDMLGIQARKGCVQANKMPEEVQAAVEAVIMQRLSLSEEAPCVLYSYIALCTCTYICTCSVFVLWLRSHAQSYLQYIHTYIHSRTFLAQPEIKYLHTYTLSRSLSKTSKTR